MPKSLHSRVSVVLLFAFWMSSCAAILLLLIWFPAITLGLGASAAAMFLAIFVRLVPSSTSKEGAPLFTDKRGNATLYD